MSISNLVTVFKGTSINRIAVILIIFILGVAFAHDLFVGFFILEKKDEKEGRDAHDDMNDTRVDYNLGVLLVAHGMPGQWNERVKKWFDEVNLPEPSALGFLEYSPEWTIDSGIEELEQQYVDRIVAIPLFILGNSSHTHEVYEALEAVDSEVDILCTGAMDDHPLIVEILIENGLRLCKKCSPDPRDKEIRPEKTTLIFYGHGDAEEWLQNWEDVAGSIKNLMKGNNSFKFKEIIYCFKGEGNLKGAVERASGHPLVVPWMIARSSFSESEIRKEVGTEILRGECEYDGRHLIDHPNVSEWVEMQFHDYEKHTVWTRSSGEE